MKIADGRSRLWKNQSRADRKSAVHVCGSRPCTGLVSLENRVDVCRGRSGAGLVSLENCVVMDLAVRRSVGAAAASAVFVVIVVGSGIENLIEISIIISFVYFI